MPVAQSSHLQQHDYDAQSKTLVVQFTNGAVYRYSGVPPTVADTLTQASSPGEYFHAKIKGQYSTEKLVSGYTPGGRTSRRREGW